MPNKKKIILFIAEGINDKISLGLCMDQILDKNTVRFEITEGDITTKYGNNSGNIVAKIGNVVKDFSGKIFKQKDFLEVVHLVDMDGAYVPNDAIIEGTEGKNQYKEEFIETSNVQRMIDRNNQKQEILDRMVHLPKVWGSIPYSVYYFSCNMDHVLYNKANLSREEKVKYAKKFEDEFFGKSEEFIKLFNSGEFTVEGSYEETWKFIRTEKNSLKRYSNFGEYIKVKQGK